MRPSDFEQEELLMMLQDALTSAAAGHTEHLRCPVCDKSDLEVEPRDDGWIHVSCPQCKLDFEGLIANPEEAYTPGSGRKIRDPFG